MSLDELKCGEYAEIVELHGNEKLCKRLTSLGFIKGATLMLKRKVLFGETLIINIRGFDIALRKSDIKGIILK
ncbi:MAG: FeoA domain-containing protein [Clostridium perfringens]|nr:FeoA domain-containing protein [Clostridium perfringens]